MGIFSINFIFLKKKMGGKKKGGDKKKADKKGDEEDLSVENFWKAYKKKCVEYNCDVSKIIKGEFEKV